MRIPKDIPLATYIKRLIKANKIELFYLSDDWRELRLDVLETFHYECQECLKKGTYTRADCVHHINEVKHRPDLALSRYFIDRQGNQQINLMPLCNTCHNVIHEKLSTWQNRNKFMNKERW